MSESPSGPEPESPEQAAYGASTPPVAEVAEPPPMPPPGVPRASVLKQSWEVVRDFVVGAKPTFFSALLRLSLLSVILFTRFPTTNYIFDEQEALLANPYVNATGGIPFGDAIHLDFWGLPPERSVGSYRPIPNFLWRLTWHISKAPFFHHFYNLLFHAVNGAILVALTYALTRRRAMSWLAGTLFVACAVITEAVSGIVGIADVLGGMGALLALAALLLPGWAMPLGVFASVLFGLFCKESALVCVPLVPVAALLFAPLSHPERPRRALRALLSLAAATAAFVLYVELRKGWFPSPLPSELSAPLAEGASQAQTLMREFLVWFHQAPLPKDPMNNPLANAETPYRIAGALRVYFRGVTQVVFPWTLSGDYSFPQEPVPETLYSIESVLGGALMVTPLLAAVALWVTALFRERRDRKLAPPPQAPARGPIRLVLAAFFGGLSGATVLIDALVFAPKGNVAQLFGVPFWAFAGPFAILSLGLFAEVGPAGKRADEKGHVVPIGRAGLLFAALGLTWMVVSYFPHSNIPIVLPTVRAERFWYFPAIGTSLALAALFAYGLEAAKKPRAKQAMSGFIALFLGLQCVKAYAHATDYRDDLSFWGATKDAVPNSAKAHLNYSVMLGARGDLQTRLEESKKAIELAPEWPMAHIYTGDTLCRLHRVEEAWPYYKKGFDLGPNDLSLIALALQCLYDEGTLHEHEADLRAYAENQNGTWIAYLATDTLDHGEENKGVDPKYRPRGYNEGPKNSE